MEKKLLIQDIAEAIATKGGISKKTSESFVKALFETIEQGLTEDKFVKIKGLGTFKVIAVGERESVNINTGERFSISGHDKITFTPETSLKDLVNRPFSHFQTVILNEETDIEELESIDNANQEQTAENQNIIKSNSDNTYSQNESLSLDESNTDIENEIRTNSKNTNTTSTADSNKKDSQNSNEVTITDNKNQTEDTVTPTDKDLAEEVVGSSTIQQESTLDKTECESEHNDQAISSEKGELIHSDEIFKKNEQENDEQAQTSNEDKPSIDIELVTEKDSVDEQIPQKDFHKYNRGNRENRTDVDENEKRENVEKTDSCDRLDERKPLEESVYSPQNRIKKHLVLKKTLYVILSVAILLLTYFAGYFKIFCPCDIFYNTTHMENVPMIPPISDDSLLIERDSLANDSIVSNNDTILSDKTPTPDLQTTVIVGAKNQSGNIDDGQNSTANHETQPAIVKVSYKQVAGGKYEITGTLRTHKIERGETIRTIAQEVYGSKGYATYIITHNELTNPNLIDTGTVIKLPKLKRKK